MMYTVDMFFQRPFTVKFFTTETRSLILIIVRTCFRNMLFVTYCLLHTEHKNDLSIWWMWLLSRESCFPGEWPITNAAGKRSFIIMPHRMTIETPSIEECLAANATLERPFIGMNHYMPPQANFEQKLLITNVACKWLFISERFQVHI